MASIREQIMAAIFTSLGAVGAPAGLTIHRERTRPIETDSLPAILLYAHDDTPKPIAGERYRAPLTERQLTVVLECRAQGSSSTPVDAALDPVYLWATQRMFADVSFGGLANEVEEGPSEWQSKEGNVPVASCAAHFTVKYRTSRLDPSKTNSI